MPEVPNIRPVPQLPEFRWNQSANRYIAPNGQFLPFERVRGQLDKFITGVTDDMAAVSRSLVSGEIRLAQWQTEMMGLIKEANLAGGALERGGWYQMSQADFGRVGAKVRGEYDFLRNFASEIEAGTQRLDGTLPNRARLYGEQGRVTYYDFSREKAIRDGFDEERSVVTPGENCEECIAEESKGWVPIDTLVPIGSRICLSNCNCFMRYRNSASGDTRTA